MNRFLHRPTAMARWRCANALLFLVVLGCSGWALGEDMAESEDQIRQKEREDERNSPEGQKKFEREVNGKILLNPEWVAQARQDGMDSRDVGTFVSDKGHGFVLRVCSPSALKTAEKYNGKTVVASGRVEVNGKYFLLREITTSQGAGPGRKKLGGL